MTDGSEQRPQSLDEQAAFVDGHAEQLTNGLYAVQDQMNSLRSKFEWTYQPYASGGTVRFRRGRDGDWIFEIIAPAEKLAREIKFCSITDRALMAKLMPDFLRSYAAESGRRVAIMEAGLTGLAEAQANLDQLLKGGA